MEQRRKKPTVIGLSSLAGGLFTRKEVKFMGFDSFGTSLFAVFVQKQGEKCFFRLCQCPFDICTLQISKSIHDVPLFCDSPGIVTNLNHFIIAAWISHDSGAPYIIYGYDSSEQNPYVHFTCIYKDTEPHHFGFPSNSTAFTWNPRECISSDFKIIALNCVSSVKIIRIGDDGTIRRTQFDVEEYLLKKVGSDTFNIEKYETSIIQCMSDTFILFIGFIYFNTSKEEWRIVGHLLSLHPFGAGVKFLHSLSKGFKHRKSNLNLSQIMESMKKLLTNLIDPPSPTPWKHLQSDTNLVQIPNLDIYIVRYSEEP